MIPKSLIDANITIIDTTETTSTYKISGARIQGSTDSLNALQQAIYKVLQTEKYEYPIYSFNYGVELESLIGKDLAYIKVELKRRIRECLLQDERIKDVENFNYQSTGDSLLCSFVVTSIYGNISVSKEVSF